MAFFGKEVMDIALKKEETRGTVETSPDKFLKVSRDSGFQYDLEHLENDRIQGQKLGEFAPEAGRKIATGKITGDLEANTIGELLYSCLGAFTNAQVGTTTAWDHTFSISTTTTGNPGYTFFIDRGVDHYRYTLGVVKRLEMEGDAQGKAIFNADIIAKTEQTADAYAPTIAVPDPLMFHEASIEIDDSAITTYGKWNVSIDNQAEALWTINGSQDATDIVIAKKPIIEGSLDLYFAGKSERTAFLANTETKIEIILTGGALAGVNYKVHTTLYGVRYTAVPWDGELDGGLMGATMAFKGFYNVSDSKAIDVVVTNAFTTY